MKIKQNVSKKRSTLKRMNNEINNRLFNEVKIIYKFILNYTY